MKYIKNKSLKKYFTILYLHLSRKNTLKDNFILEQKFQDDDFFSPIHAANLELLFAKALHEVKKFRPLEICRIRDIAEQTFFLFPARKGIVSKMAFFTHIASHLVKYEDKNHLKDLKNHFAIDISYRSKAEFGENILYSKKILDIKKRKLSIEDFVNIINFGESVDRSFGEFDVISESSLLSFPKNPVSFYKAIIRKNRDLGDLIKIIAKVNIHNFNNKDYQAYATGISITSYHFMLLALEYCDRYEFNFSQEDKFLTIKQLIKDTVRVDIEKYIEFDSKNQKIKVLHYFDNSIHHSIIEVLIGINLAINFSQSGLSIKHEKIFDIKDFKNIVISSIKKSYLMIERKGQKEDLILLNFLDKFTS
jgi:hypothetical protein